MNVGQRATVTGNIVRGNIASTVERGYGGGVLLSGGVITFAGNVVQENIGSAADYAWGGGLILFKGNTNDTIILIGNTIISNTGSTVSYGYGGGLYTSEGSRSLVNNIIAANRAGPNGQGDGLYTQSPIGPSDQTLLYNTFADNETTAIVADANATVILTNTIISGSAIGISTTYLCEGLRRPHIVVSEPLHRPGEQHDHHH